MLGVNPMTQMTQEQEIRCKALEMKINYIASIVNSGRSYNGNNFWNDGDLEEFVAYIKDGVKPKKE